MSLLRLLSPRDGDLLNFHDGRQAADRLLITVRGEAPPQATVMVNGVATNSDGGVFAVEVALTDFIGDLEVVAGAERAVARVYWDQDAGRRYRFSTDDNIYFLKDLATQDYASLFDNPYLGFWRRMHERYGNRVQHNIYDREPGGFDLTQMPARYRSEWRDNADWLKLTFHAQQNDPPKPYLDSGYDELARDFERVTEQIRRFAGEEVLSPFTTVHWGEATFDGCRALRDRGIIGLAGYCHADPPAEEGGLWQPKVSYYLDDEQVRHLAGRDAWRDHRLNLWFIKHDLVANTMPPERIRPHLDSVFANPHRRELMEVMIHEQYFCEFLPNYQPDVEQRVIETIEWLVEHDYASVFHESGVLAADSELQRN